MKIATYNANSIRIRLPIVLDWMAANEPDVLALQETKVEDDKFPAAEFEEMGYQVSFHGQKSYNGVAIVSREPARSLSTGLADPTLPEDCRVMLAEVGGVWILNTYVPNGRAINSEPWFYKLKWFERFRTFCDQRLPVGAQAVWLGDMNVAPKPEDVHNPKKLFGHVGHHPREFEALGNAVAWGWEDVFRKFTQGPGHYTYFDFVIRDSVAKNAGWRIDHIYASAEMAARCTGCRIEMSTRTAERPSDHALVLAEFA